MMIISIAWKNIWRNKLRSMVVMLAIAVGLVAGIFSVAIMKGMLVQRVNTAVNNEVSSLQLHRVEYLDNNESDFTITGCDSLMEVISARDDVAAVSKRLKVEAMVNSGHGPRGVMLLGVEPEKEKQVSQIHTCITDSNGNYFTTKTRNPIVISQRLAEKLKVHLRSKIQVDAVSKNGQAVSSIFRVVGIYNTVNALFDEVNVFVRYKDMARLLEFNKDEAHEIAVLTKNIMETDSSETFLKSRLTFYTIDSVTLNKINVSGLKPYIKRYLESIKGYEFTRAQMDSLLKKNINPEDLKVSKNDIMSACESGISVMSWKEISPELALTTHWMDMMLYIFVGIILMALGFGIVNTMLMVVLERVKELGMLMAVGMNRYRVYVMVVLETVFLSLAGGILGIVLSYVLVKYYAVTGIDLSLFSEAMNSLGYSNMIYPFIDLKSYIQVTVMVIITGILAALYPAWKAIKLNPAEAVRSE